MGQTKPNWQHRLLEALEPVYKPRFDRTRAERVYRTYDETHGFGRYTEICRAAFERAAEACEDTPLQRNGLLHLGVLTADRAGELLDAIRDGSDAGVIKGGKRPLSGLKLRDPALRDAILDAVLPSAVDRHLTGFFGSEYLVLWMTVTPTAPAVDPPTVSFTWHCDKGPRTHLKLLVYLNSTREHGGNTEFLPLPESLAVARAGYPFGRVRERVRDVADLERVVGQPLTTTLREMDAGGGVIFQPATVLHRGVTPTRAARYVVTLCLLPSPLHWREALARGTLLDLAAEPKWPRHADDLLHTLGWPQGR